MSEPVAFVQTRLAATRDAEAAVAADWKWEESHLATPAGNVNFATDAATLNTLQEAAANAEATYLAQRGVLDGLLDSIHKQTQTFVQFARVKFRDDANKASLLRNLTTRGDSRRAILDEALRAASAWKEIDEAYAPTPQVSLDNFNDVLSDARAQFDTYEANRTALRKAAEAVNVKAAQVNRHLVAWYALATRIFLAGTANGDMIRGTIPTTYTPPHGDGGDAEPSPEPLPAP